MGYPCQQYPEQIGACRLAAGEDAAVFACFLDRAPRLLRGLRADNMPAFAHLVMAAVMQARPGPRHMRGYAQAANALRRAC